MNKNGFTLVELLAVFVVLGVISLMVVPNVMNLFNEKKDVLYDATIEELERLSSVYLTDNPNLYRNMDVIGYIDITTDELCMGDYIECPITDSRDNSEINGYIRVSCQNEKCDYKFVREE